MNNWEILGMEPTEDIEAVKKAYAEKSKQYHPETHPDQFNQLHQAYKSIISGRTVSPKKSTSEILSAIKKESFSEQQRIEAELIARKNLREEVLTAQQNLSEENAFLAYVDNATLERLEADRKRFQLDQFEDMLANRYYPSNWRKYFTSDEFLDNQYDPYYIKAIAKAYDNRIKQPDKKSNNKIGRCPQYGFIYLIIAYGCMFNEVGTLPIKENVYKLELLEPLQRAFRLYDSMFLSYVLVEKDETLLSERFAFYVYRNILDILDNANPDIDELCQWVAWGVAKEHDTRLLDICHYSPSNGKRVTPDKTRFHDVIKRSPLIFELISHLLEKASTPPVFKQVVREVCEAYMTNPYCGDEIRILYLMTE